MCTPAAAATSTCLVSASARVLFRNVHALFCSIFLQSILLGEFLHWEKNLCILICDKNCFAEIKFVLCNSWAIKMSK